MEERKDSILHKIYIRYKEMPCPGAGVVAQWYGICLA